MSVFSQLYASSYDALYAEKDYRGECDLVEAALARAEGGDVHTILDLGCGTGGHAIELARRGYSLTGVDLSAGMLGEAARKAEILPEGSRPRWIEGDARDFEAGGPFDAAIMMFAVISYMTSNADVLAALRSIRRHLRTGATFACDFWFGPAVLMVQPSERVRVLELGGTRVIRSASTVLSPIQHTADVTFRLWTLEQERLVSETEETHKMRYFFPQEFPLLLEMAGFESLSLSAFPSLDAPVTADTWNAFSIARAK